MDRWVRSVLMQSGWSFWKIETTFYFFYFNDLTSICSTVMLIAACSSSINRPLSSCCRCSSFWIRSNYLGSVWVVSDRPFWIWPLFKSISARRVRTDTDLQYIDFYTVNILQNHWVGRLTWQLYRNKLLRFTAEYMMRQQTTLNTVKQHSVTTQWLIR